MINSLRLAFTFPMRVYLLEEAGESIFGREVDLSGVSRKSDMIGIPIAQLLPFDACLDVARSKHGKSRPVKMIVTYWQRSRVRSFNMFGCSGLALA